MTEERRYFPQVCREPFSPDQEVELDELWTRMAVDLLGTEETHAEERCDHRRRIRQK